MMLKLCLALGMLVLLVGPTVYQQASADSLSSPPSSGALAPLQFHLTVTSDPNILYIEGSGDYGQGQSVTTGMAPEQWQGYRFVGWQVDGQWYGGNPVTIRMDAAHVATAKYSIGQALGTVTIDTVPRAGNVLVDGWVYLSSDLPLKFNWIVGSKHTIAIENAKVKEGADKREVFDKWTDLSTDPYKTIKVNNDNMTLKALFKTQYYLKVISDYGKVEGGGWYDDSQTAEFKVSPTAITDTGERGHRYVFAGWDDGDYKNSPKNSIAIEKPTTVKASWKEQYKLKLISSIPEVEVAGSGWYDKGQKVALITPDEQASNDTDIKFVFGTWRSTGQIPVAISDPKSTYASLTMDDAYTVKANWKKSYYVNVVTPYGNAAGSGYYDQGTYADISLPQREVDIESGKVKAVFAGWDTGGAEVAKSVSPQQNALNAAQQNALNAAQQNTPNIRVRVDQPITVAAKWSEQYHLDVASAQGKVSGEGWYKIGQSAGISVEAPSTPAGLWVRYTFDRWSGDYQGSETSELVRMDQPKTIKAEWKEDYSPGIMNSAIMSGVGAVGMFVYRRKKKNGNGSGIASPSIDLSKLPLRFTGLGVKNAPTQMDNTFKLSLPRGKLFSMKKIILKGNKFFRIREQFFSMKKIILKGNKFFRIREKFFRIREKFFRIREKFFRIREKFFSMKKIKLKSDYKPPRIGMRLLGRDY